MRVSADTVVGCGQPSSAGAVEMTMAPSPQRREVRMERSLLRRVNTTHHHKAHPQQTAERQRKRKKKKRVCQVCLLPAMARSRRLIHPNWRCVAPPPAPRVASANLHLLLFSSFWICPLNAESSSRFVPWHQHGHAACANLSHESGTLATL